MFYWILEERALKKKFICVRFSQRNDAMDALTDIIVLNRNKRPPKGYVSAGYVLADNIDQYSIFREVDGAMICFKASAIPASYGVKQNVPTSSL